MPTWHSPEHHVDKPTTDQDYFERMSRMILVPGKHFTFLGKGTTVMYLFSVGEGLPEATQDWEARHRDA